IVVNAYRLSVALDSEGYLVGSGEGKVKVTTEHINRAPWGSDQNVLLAFKDKKIYTYIANTYSEGGAKRVYSEYSVTSQDDAGLGYIKQYVEMFYGESVKKVFGILLDGNTKNSPINAGIAKVMDFLFDRKASASGYTLTLNYDNAAKAVEYANTHTAAEVIDAIIGEGKFSSIVEFMKDFPEMTLDEFIFKAKGIADEFGLSINDFYAIIDSAFKAIDKDSKVNALDYVSKNGSKKMSAMVEELSGGKISADSLKSIISNIVAEYVPMLKNAELSFIKLLASFVPVSDKDFDLAGYIKSSLDALNASAKNKIGVVIKTDSSGAFESVAVNANGFEHTQNVPAAVAREDVTIKVSGKMSFVITTVQGAISNNINIVTATEKAKADFEAIVKKNVGKVVDSERGNSNYTFTIITKDGKYAYVPNIDTAYANKYLYNMSLENENGSYNGVACSVYSLSVWGYGYVFDFDGDYSYRTSCTGWVENTISTTYLHEQYYKVYRNGNNILGVEFDWKKSLEDTWSDYHMEIYSNAAQGKLSFSDPHKYVLINKSEDPTKCEQTVYDTYRCTACGQLRYDYRTKWHDYEYTYELKSGAKDCSGGVVMVGKCKDCGDTDRYEYDGIGYDGKHRTFNYEYSVKGAACEDTVMVVVRCVCGSYVRDVYVGGNGPDACDFDYREVGCGETDCKYYRHYVYEHQCYLSDCGYTYKHEHIETIPDKNCMSKSWEVITLKDGTKYTTTAVESVMHQITSDTTQEGELSVNKYTCSNCKTLFSLEKFDKYGREVYYYSYDRKSGWEIVIDKNCNYVRYSLDSEGKRGEQTGSGVDHVVRTVSTEDKKNCTQPHERVRSCAACGLKTTVNYFYGHSFKFDYEADMYKCVDCGMTNDNWAEAPIRLEDLNKGEYTDGNLKIGYHTACRIKADIEFYTDYDYGYGNFVEVIYDEKATSEESGIITIAKDEVMQLLEGGAQSFTVVFTINRVFNYEGYEYRTYEIAITFTIEELVTILGLNA
ncbi:MAG: hypothetical protein K2L88_04695, partial [Clostridiales bacterium]|nr:hypothetical protein [Clostridiales bacterium]